MSVLRAFSETVAADGSRGSCERQALHRSNASVSREYVSVRSAVDVAVSAREAVVVFFDFDPEFDTDADPDFGWFERSMARGSVELSVIILVPSVRVPLESGSSTGCCGRAETIGLTKHLLAPAMPNRSRGLNVSPYPEMRTLDSRGLFLNRCG